MKLGRLPADPERIARAPQLAAHRFAAAPPLPSLDRSAVPFLPRLFGNDTLPDCTGAALANAALAVSALNGFETAILDADVPAFYAECIGMPRASPAQLAATDGAVALDVLRYQFASGLGVGAQTVLCALFGAVREDRAALANALVNLGPGYWGVTLTERDMATAHPGIVWDTEGDSSPPAGGHMLVGWDYSGLGDLDTVRLATWGAFKRATWRWVEARLEEAYGLVWRQLARADGADLGVDVAALEAQLSAA